MSESKWHEGAEAAARGAVSIDCPYKPEHYDFVTWHNGWASKTYWIAMEAANKRYAVDADIKPRAIKAGADAPRRRRDDWLLE